MAFTFDSNGSTITILNAGGLNANGTNTKTLSMGASTWNVSGNFGINGSALTFNKGTSTVTIKNTSTIAAASGNNFYNLQTASAAFTITLNTDITVINTFIPTNANGAVTWNGNNVFAQGDFKTNSSGDFGTGSGTTTFNLTGSANQSIDDQLDASNEFIFNPFVINKSGGTATWTNATHGYRGNSWTYTAGTTAFGTSTIVFRSSTPNSGTINFNNVTISNSTITLSGNMNINGNLVNNGTFSPGSNTVTLVGNLTNNNVIAPGTGTYVFNGTSTVAGDTTIGDTDFYNITINSGKTVHLTSTHVFRTAVAGTFTANSCTLDATVATSAAKLTVRGGQSVNSVTATDIDSSGAGGVAVNNCLGTNTRTTNWTLLCPFVAKFKKSLSAFGTRVGSRQLIGV